MPLVQIFDQFGIVAFGELVRFSIQDTARLEVRNIALTEAGERAYGSVTGMLVGREFHIASPGGGPTFIGCKVDKFSGPKPSVRFLALGAVNADGTSVMVG